MKLRILIAAIVCGLLIPSLNKAFADDTNAAPTHFQIEMLKSILADADQAAKDNDQPARTKYLQEFLTKSSEAGDISTLTNIWILRAAAAIELNDDQKAWEAGQKLISFHLDNSDDPQIEKIMVALGRKDLIGTISPEAKAQAAQQKSKQEQAARWIGVWKIQPADDGCTADGELNITADLNFDLIMSGHFSVVCGGDTKLLGEIALVKLGIFYFPQTVAGKFSYQNKESSVSTSQATLDGDANPNFLNLKFNDGNGQVYGCGFIKKE